MHSARARARSAVEELTSAWLGGDDDAISSACTADVRWWTPVEDGTATGPADASSALRRVLAPLRQPVTVTAVVPNDDGSRCVVEMRSAAAPPAFVTSVLSLHDGKISAGRTYTDLQGRDQHPRPDAA